MGKTRLKAMRLGNRGSHHIIITVLFLFLSLVGAWSIYTWYKAGTVKQNLSQMLADFKQTADASVTNSRDKGALDEKINEIRQIIGKYNNDHE